MKFIRRLALGLLTAQCTIPLFQSLSESVILDERNLLDFFGVSASASCLPGYCKQNGKRNRSVSVSERIETLKSAGRICVAMDESTAGLQTGIVELFDLKQNKNNPLLDPIEGKIRHQDGSVEDFVTDRKVENEGEYWVAYEYDTTLTGDIKARIKNIEE